MLVMLLREAAYGINVGLSDVTIAPFGNSDFHYHIGNVDVDYSRDAVMMTLPGSGDKNYAISGLVPNSVYQVIATHGHARVQHVGSDANGTLRFVAPIGSDVQVRVTLDSQ